jgi:hypothetical protein
MKNECSFLQVFHEKKLKFQLSFIRLFYNIGSDNGRT